jgi:hypothetical protein
MAITRTSEGTLIIGSPFRGDRAIEVSAAEDAGNIAVIHWMEEGVGLDVNLDEALAIRDELNSLIDRARNAGEA